MAVGNDQNDDSSQSIPPQTPDKSQTAKTSKSDDSPQTAKNTSDTSDQSPSETDIAQNVAYPFDGNAETRSLTEAATVDARQSHQGRGIFLVGTIIAAVLAVIIIVAGTYGYWDHKHGEKRDYQQLQSLAQKPIGMTEQGGLPTFKASDYNPKAPDLDLYVDFFCPGCANIEHRISKPLKLMQKAKQVNLYIHPVNFLDSYSRNKYSTRAASAFAYVSSHEPDKALDFSTRLFDKDYQPNKGNNRKVSNKEIVRQALKAGVSKTVARQAVKGTYSDYVDTATKYTIRRKELYVHMQEEFRFSTPTICINGTMWHYRRLHVLQDIEPTLIHSLGLHRQQVGNAKIMPSIGPDGQALPIQQKYLS
ncbi:thioredoxin domain-containing protein [Bifidobacterium sp. ESL0704]|uniref:DsbA family protein n=1 Tax=Bifidobacterium sp. ESL0704 TaxID=2983219 RepID=UPI0023F876D0|nr:thioredoxin domain-containing protein [Bifidobacterium sp. ESL0704]WEV53568.1 thioredoxin domain-containing protein [Bifidobacterium sp. ESL0704]